MHNRFILFLLNHQQSIQHLKLLAVTTERQPLLLLKFQNNQFSSI